MISLESIIESVGGKITSFRSTGHGLILLTLAMGWFFTTGVRLIYPVLVPQVRTAFGINNTIAGLLFTVMVVMIALTQFPSGIMADRFGERSVLSLSVVGSTVGVVLLAGAPVFPVFFVGCVLYGLAAGLFQSPTISALTRIFPERSGSTHGVIFASGSIGTSALPVIASGIAVTIGWRFAYVLSVPIFALLVVGIWYLIPKREPELRADASSSLRAAVSGIRGVLRRDILFVASAMILVVIVFHGVSAFLPTYLIEVKGTSQLVATTVFGLFFVGGFVLQLAAGVGADRWSNRAILFAITAVAAVSVVGLTRSSGIVPIAVLSIALSSVAAYISVANTYFASTLPDDTQGSGIGALRTVIIGIGGTSPLVTGYFGDANQFDVAFLLFGGCLVVAASVLALSFVVIRPD